MGCVADSVATQMLFLLELQFGLYEYHREPILPDPFLGGTAPRLLYYRNYCCLPLAVFTSSVLTFLIVKFSFQVHSTRGDGHQCTNLCVDQTSNQFLYPPQSHQRSTQGAREYLEVLAQIDTPQLFQPTSRGATLRTPERGHITFNSEVIFVGFLSHISDYYAVFSVRILCTASDWYCTPLSTLKDLYIFEDRVNPPLWQFEDDIDLIRL